MTANLDVQEKRLELSWYCYHTDLNRARLPIPPFLHFCPPLISCEQNVLYWFSDKKSIEFLKFLKQFSIFYTFLYFSILSEPP